MKPRRYIFEKTSSKTRKFDYPEAGHNAQPGVQEDIIKWEELPNEKKVKKPLLYWLLGSGTPPYKMSKKDSDYQSTPKGNQKCSTCEFMYENVYSGYGICSQVAGKIERQAWCRLWKEGKV